MALLIILNQRWLPHVLPAGAVVQDMCLSTVTSFEWSADGTALYYSTADETGRPSKVIGQVPCDSVWDAH
jgi:protease II